MKLIFIIFSLSLYRRSGSIDNPIILIPGIGGSRIEVKMDDNVDVPNICQVNSSGNRFTQWMNTIYCLVQSPACTYEVLQLNYDKIKRETRNRPGIHTQVSGFGTTEKFSLLDLAEFMSPYFKPLTYRMTREGYIPGLSIRTASYDFRKAPHEQMDYLRRLKELIEDTYEKNYEKKIILIVHSLGGLLTTMFLRRQSKEWKDQYIKSVISLSVGWAGTVKAIEAYMKGFSIRLAEITPKCSFSNEPPLEQTHKYVLLPKLTVVPADILGTLPSVIWLFPSTKAWQKTDVLVRSRTPVEKTYTLNNIKEFFTDLGHENGWEMYDDVESFQKEISDPGVELHCLYGTNIDTIALVDYSTSIRDSLNFPITENGDGMVNLRSLAVCEDWSEKNTIVKTKSFWGVGHLEMLSDLKVLNHIVSIIFNN